MPIYEFYCPDCHRMFSFLARSVAPEKRPRCPDCGLERIERRVSRFAVATRGAIEARDASPDAEAPPGVDEARMEQAMESMAHEAERVDENDPRALGRLMRKFYDSSGMQMGEGMEEAVRRMESGEDPDRIEADLGDALETEDPLVAAGRGLRGARRRLEAPSVDPELHEL
ncbi:MAG: zinc ribbon domain-containing protein [bacterium]|nr:zinc ribbon domain-containing protein [bacterium]